MKVHIIEGNIKPKDRSKAPNSLMSEKIRETAYECSEEAWDALLDNAGSEAARAIWKAMTALADRGNYAGAVAILSVLYALRDRELPRDAAAYQDRPALLRAFSDEYLDEYEFDEDGSVIEMDDLDASLADLMKTVADYEQFHPCAGGDVLREREEV